MSFRSVSRNIATYNLYGNLSRSVDIQIARFFFRIVKEISKNRICARESGELALCVATFSMRRRSKTGPPSTGREKEREKESEAAPGETGIHCARTSVRIWLSIVGAFPRILALSSCLYLGRTVIKHR